MINGRQTQATPVPHAPVSPPPPIPYPGEPRAPMSVAVDPLHAGCAHRPGDQSRQSVTHVAHVAHLC